MSRESESSPLALVCPPGRPGPDLDRSKWSAFTQPDPTHGLVEYVSHDTASSEGMTQVLPSGAAVLSVDNTTDLPLNAPRKSCVLCSQTFVEILHN
jgi:hypothetical protein